MSHRHPQNEDEWLISSALSSVRNLAKWQHQAEQLKVAADTVMDHHKAAQYLYTLRSLLHNERFPLDVASIEDGPPPILVSLPGERESLDGLFEVIGMPEMWSWPIYMMLAGYALENLAKGILIAIEPDLVPTGIEATTGTVLPSAIKSHNLVQLLERIEFALTAEERDVVERIETCVIWGGRYPVPTKPIDLRQREDPTGELAAPLQFRGTDVRLVDTLYGRLEELITRHQANARDGDGRADLAAMRSAVEEELRTTHEVHEEPNGMVRFRVAGEGSQDRDDPGGAIAVSCGGCRMQLTLSPAEPAGICGCGNLRRRELHWEPSAQALRPISVSYPPSTQPGRP